jgi:hypothetical protein
MSKVLPPPPPGKFGEAVLMTTFFLLRLNVNSESTVLLSSHADGRTNREPAIVLKQMVTGGLYRTISQLVCSVRRSGPITCRKDSTDGVPVTDHQHAHETVAGID